MGPEKYFIGLMGLGVNDSYRYERFFAMIPTGSDPSSALTRGLFEAASQLAEKPKTMTILAADADFAWKPIAETGPTQFATALTWYRKPNTASQRWTSRKSSKGRPLIPPTSSLLSHTSTTRSACCELMQRSVLNR